MTPGPFSLLAWLVSCLYVEPHLVNGYDPRNRMFKMTPGRYVLSVCSWAESTEMKELAMNAAVDLRARDSPPDPQ